MSFALERVFFASTFKHALESFRCKNLLSWKLRQGRSFANVLWKQMQKENYENFCNLQYH